MASDPQHEMLEHLGSLRAFAVSLTRDRTLADDLVQECLLRAVSRRKLWIGRRGMRPWLFTILHNIFVKTMTSQ